MFEQIASLENQFKTTMTNSEKIAVAIEKLPAEYQLVLTAEMHQEESGITAFAIKNAAFQYWRSVYGSYATNAMIDGTQEDKQNDKEVALMAFNGTCHQCG